MSGRHWEELRMNSLRQDKTFTSVEFQQLIKYELDVISVSDNVIVLIAFGVSAGIFAAV